MTAEEKLAAGQEMADAEREHQRLMEETDAIDDWAARRDSFRRCQDAYHALLRAFPPAEVAP